MSLIIWIIYCESSYNMSHIVVKLKPGNGSVHQSTPLIHVYSCFLYSMTHYDESWLWAYQIPKARITSFIFNWCFPIIFINYSIHYIDYRIFSYATSYSMWRSMFGKNEADRRNFADFAKKRKKSRRHKWRYVWHWIHSLWWF